MFGIGKWFKTQTKVGQRIEAAKDRLEKLAEDHGFKVVFETVKGELDKTVNELERNFLLSGFERGQKFIEWLRNTYPNTIPYSSRFLEWVSAWVDLKKAAGLFK